jgi:hypothetical protein
MEEAVEVWLPVFEAIYQVQIEGVSAMRPYCEWTSVLGANKSAYVLRN